MTQQYLTPHRPKRPASRLVAGLLWLIAAGLAVGATFADIVIYQFAADGSLFVVGFWRQYGLTADGQENSPGTIYYGASEVAGGAFLLLATLLVFLSARRWAAVVAGAMGAGMLVTSALTWFLTALSKQANTTMYIQSGLWVLAGATGVALLAFLVSLFEREKSAPPQSADLPLPPQSADFTLPPQSADFTLPPLPPVAPPPPPAQPPPPRWEPESWEQETWEPETPKYGVSVPEPPTRPKTEPATEPKTKPKTRPSTEPRTEPDSKPVAVSDEEDVFFDAFDSPEFTASITPPRPPQTPETRTSSRKIDGDEK
jgi:hypothetical protein